MKHLIILVFFSSLLITAQGYEAKYKADICACIEAKKNTFQTADKIYYACFSKHLSTYASFIDAQIKEDDKTKKFIASQKIRKELIQRFKYELVSSCDAYIDIIEGKKLDVIQQFRSRKIDSAQIDKLNESVAMRPHWTSYFARGNFYYVIGNLQKAEQDVLKSIEENPLNKDNLVTSQENFLLALIYEEKKQYTKAIAIYDAINSKSLNPSVELLKAIVIRKKNGYVFKTKNTSKKDIPALVLKGKQEKEPIKTSSKTINNIPQTDSTQTNSSKLKNRKKETVSKNKDSTQSLRKLFKIN